MDGVFSGYKHYIYSYMPVQPASLKQIKKNQSINKPGQEFNALICCEDCGHPGSIPQRSRNGLEREKV